MPTDRKKDPVTLLKLRDIRRAKGMSLSALAKKVGIDYQRVGRIERGETQMTIDLLRRIAKALQVPLTQLLGEEEVTAWQNPLASTSRPTASIDLIPIIYEKLDTFCQTHHLTADNLVKVHLATVMFKAIQDIRTNVTDDAAMVAALFQAFAAMFERLVLRQEKADDAPQ